MRSSLIRFLSLAHLVDWSNYNTKRSNDSSTRLATQKESDLELHRAIDFSAMPSTWKSTRPLPSWSVYEFICRLRSRIKISRQIRKWFVEGEQKTPKQYLSSRLYSWWDLWQASAQWMLIRGNIIKLGRSLCSQQLTSIDQCEPDTQRLLWQTFMLDDFLHGFTRWSTQRPWFFISPMINEEKSLTSI